MKRIILALFLIMIAFSQSIIAQDIKEERKLVVLPEIPDKLTNPQARANYMTEHMWDACDLEKTKISDIEAYHNSFTDYLSFFLVADKETVDKSIKKFVERLSKNEDNRNLTIGMVNAEVLNIYGRYYSEEVYGMFVKYFTANKKLSKEVRETLQQNLAILNNSAEGAQVQDFPLRQSPSGVASLGELKSGTIVLFFNQKDCVDCSIAKVRLSANLSVSKFIRSGELSIVSVWDDRALMEEKLASEPADWEVALLENMGKIFDMRVRPTIYLLDRDKKIVRKFVNTDDLLGAVTNVERNQQEQLKRDMEDQQQ